MQSKAVVGLSTVVGLFTAIQVILTSLVLGQPDVKSTLDPQQRTTVATGLLLIAVTWVMLIAFWSLMYTRSASALHILEISLIPLLLGTVLLFTTLRSPASALFTAQTMAEAYLFSSAILGFLAFIGAVWLVFEVRKVGRAAIGGAVLKSLGRSSRRSRSS